MSENKFLKLLCSIPICLIVLYFIPFLGFCLLLFRHFIYRNKSNYSTSIYLIIIGLILIIPKLLDTLFIEIKYDITKIPYYTEIVRSDIYESLLSYSKTLIVCGVILLILSYIFKNIFNKVGSAINSTAANYIRETEKQDREISEKNDLLMKEKQLKAKNTHAVKCPNCGNITMLTEQTGICQFCRQTIEYKE